MTSSERQGKRHFILNPVSFWRQGKLKQPLKLAGAEYTILGDTSQNEYTERKY